MRTSDKHISIRKTMKEKFRSLRKEDLMMLLPSLAHGHVRGYMMKRCTKRKRYKEYIQYTNN